MSLAPSATATPTPTATPAAAPGATPDSTPDRAAAAAPHAVVVASSAADASALEALVAEHAELLGTLEAHVGRVVAAVVNADVRGADHERSALLGWCTSRLLPRGEAAAALVHPAARAEPRARALADALVGTLGVVRELVQAIRSAVNPVVVAANVHALRVVVTDHLAVQDEIFLPLLAGSPAVSLATVREEVRARLAGPRPPREERGAVAADGPAEPGASCGCGGHDDAGYPELDATAIPHAIRHATIFGALETVTGGGGLVLLAPHAPTPLLRQVADRWPGRFTVSYLEEGPEVWKVLFLAP